MEERFENFVALIFAIQKHIQRIKSLEMRELGLKGPHVMCLFHLHQQGEAGLAPSDLCRLTGVDKAAVSRILAELLKRGYVAYPQAGAGRRYRAKARLTPQGLEAARQINAVIRDMVAEAGAALPPKGAAQDPPGGPGLTKEEELNSTCP